MSDNSKKLSPAAKRSRVVAPKRATAASRAAAIKKATSRVSAKTSIDFVRSVRGR